MLNCLYLFISLQVLIIIGFITGEGGGRGRTRWTLETGGARTDGNNEVRDTERDLDFEKGHRESAITISPKTCLEVCQLC